MGNKFFADSLFVSYIKGIPSNERIPYLQGESLTQEIVNRLTDQILSGIADFREGWSTVYILKECENYYEFVNDQFPTCETQLNITGDGPTPQKHATEDLQLIAEIIIHFMQTGMVYPDCTWEHTIH